MSLPYYVATNPSLLCAGEMIVTRDCLSNLEGHRRDIPNDRYEGCRPATHDVLLGNYIFPSIPEIDQTRLVY